MQQKSNKTQSLREKGGYGNLSSALPPKERQYSCRHCGTAYSANPPDDVHTTAVANVDGGEDDIQISYHCTACNNNNKLTWVRQSKYTLETSSVEITKAIAYKTLQLVFCG